MTFSSCITHVPAFSLGITYFVRVSLTSAIKVGIYRFYNCLYSLEKNVYLLYVHSPEAQSKRAMFLKYVGKYLHKSEKI